ncbi:MAG TPA: GMC family oxidoreductase [Polyangiaceae bacterium]|nr:GMC family oxidoreductase [Polyangiaceae bacterium]
MADRKTQVLIIGSGAGGAVTAHTLAGAGFDVTVLEEGARHGVEDYGKNPLEGMRNLYRKRGMTPILGMVPIGYVEGACVGGSTEINSGFWHRTPPSTLLRWKAQYDLDATPEELAPHFTWAENMLGVSTYGRALPKSSEVFAKGIAAMGWSGQEVPRAASRCQSTNACASGCPTGAKPGMSRSVLPQAEQFGAKVLTRCRAHLLLKRGSRVSGVLAEITHEDGQREFVRIDADCVIVCAGPTQTPLVLRRSGIRFHVGATFQIHPMLKVVARFPFEIDAHESVLPLLQVKEFWPDISLGGAFFSPGHLAMMLSDNWLESRHHMRDIRRMAAYYVAVRGSGRGHVRTPTFGNQGMCVYELSRNDLQFLAKGLGHLATLLLAAGAEEVHPTVQGLGPIRTQVEAVRWLDELLPASKLSLTTVHAFSTCPAGERRDRTALDSFGRVHDFENLYVNDASMLPDSPGVNPQGSVMALARRNALRLKETLQ